MFSPKILPRMLNVKPKYGTHRSIRIEPVELQNCSKSRNSMGTDQMSFSDLGLYCLLRLVRPNTSGIYRRSVNVRPP